MVVPAACARIGVRPRRVTPATRISTSEKTTGTQIRKRDRIQKPHIPRRLAHSLIEISLNFIQKDTNIMLPEVHLAGEERAGCNLVEIVMESVDVPTHLPQLISTKRQSYY